MEHRWGRRVAARLPVTVRTAEGGIATGILDEVSISGAHLVTGLKCLPLARLEVQIRTARARRGPQLAGVVVRRTARGVALEWLEFAARDALALVMPAPSPPDTGAENQAPAA